MSNGTVTALAPTPLPNLSFFPTNPNPNPCPRSPSSRSPVGRSLSSSSRSLSIGASSIIRRVGRCFSLLQESPISLDLPLLPFESDEVLIPSESKTLHLYEARFLALLEESLFRSKKLFVHFVLDPVLTSRSSSGASFAAKYGCLVLIENVERLQIGALVSIRGIGRVSIVNLVQMEPYLRGIVIPMQDNIPDHESEIDSKLMELREYMYDLNSLQIKLKASKDELLQTRIKNALTWAEREVYEDCDKAFIPKLAERLSFAALQPVSGCSQSELLALQRKKLQAMNSRDTSERLNTGYEYVKQNIAMVATKLAIQSLEM